MLLFWIISYIYLLGDQSSSVVSLQIYKSLFSFRCQDIGNNKIFSEFTFSRVELSIYLSSFPEINILKSFLTNILWMLVTRMVCWLVHSANLWCTKTWTKHPALRHFSTSKLKNWCILARLNVPIQPRLASSTTDGKWRIGNNINSLETQILDRKHDNFRGLIQAEHNQSGQRRSTKYDCSCNVAPH